MSPTWIVYLLVLFMLSAALCMGSALMVTNWSIDGYSNTGLVFWAGVVGGCLIPATPVSVLFLSLDRLVIIACPLRFYTHRVKCLIAGTSAALTLFIAVSYFEIMTATKPDDLSIFKGCWSFACLSSPTSVIFYAIDRFVVAVPNFIVSNRRKLGDRIALLAVVFSFIFDLLPSTINLAFTYATTENLSQRIVNVKILQTLSNDSASLSNSNKEQLSRKSFSAVQELVVLAGSWAVYQSNYPRMASNNDYDALFDGDELSPKEYLYSNVKATSTPVPK
uniref:Uncharacterized protein n=1 Tax=Ditylenchus dipsaci TaxID=166011 RepID=A0A915EE72_9BILA